MEHLRPGPDALRTILRSCGIALEHAKLERLWRYHELLRAANARLNMTRIHNFENMVLKHYVDSLLVLNFLELPSPLIDMGSGPGLPGVPLKIARPEVRMILAEPRGARAEFLQEVVAELGLQDIEVHAHKLGPDFPGQVNGIISRAVGDIGDALQRTAACLNPGGTMIFMKGPGCGDEIARAARADAGLFVLEADHAYSIPGTPHHRRLVVYRRLATPAPPQAAIARPVPEFEGPTRMLSSPSNSQFRHLRELLSGHGIRKHGQAILAGSRILAEVQQRFPQQLLGWVTDPAGPPPPRPSLTWYRLEKTLFRELDVAGTHAPLAMVRVPDLDVWCDDEPWPEGCTLFVPFQDPENVGAVIRSAAAFGVARVVLLREAAHPFHPRASRAAGTALFQVPLLQGPSIQELSARQAPLIALDTAGPELGTEPFPRCFGLVVGVEGPGLPRSLRSGPRRRIAIAPAVESLNAAASTAIALYAWSRERDAADRD